MIQIVAWIDETPAGEEHYFKSTNLFGDNPIVGSFFNRNSSRLPPKVEEIQQNIAKLESIVRASPLPISFESKMKLFKKYTWKTYREQDASAIVEALSLE